MTQRYRSCGINKASNFSSCFLGRLTQLVEQATFNRQVSSSSLLSSIAGKFPANLTYFFSVFASWYELNAYTVCGSLTHLVEQHPRTVCAWFDSMSCHCQDNLANIFVFGSRLKFVPHKNGVQLQQLNENAVRFCILCYELIAFDLLCESACSSKSL